MRHKATKKGNRKNHQRKLAKKKKKNQRMQGREMMEIENDQKTKDKMAVVNLIFQ